MGANNYATIMPLLLTYFCFGCEQIVYCTLLLHVVERQSGGHGTQHVQDRAVRIHHSLELLQLFRGDRIGRFDRHNTSNILKAGTDLRIHGEKATQVNLSVQFQRDRVQRNFHGLGIGLVGDFLARAQGSQQNFHWIGLMKMMKRRVSPWCSSGRVNAGRPLPPCPCLQCPRARRHGFQTCCESQPCYVSQSSIWMWMKRSFWQRFGPF